MNTARRTALGRAARWLVRIGGGALLLLYAGMILLTGYLLWTGTGGKASVESLCIYPLFGLVMFLFAVGAGAEFVRHLYSLDSRWDGFWFLLGSIGGMSSGYAWIAHGELSEESRETTVIKIGGPGAVGLANDSAAVLEWAGRFSRVVGPGYAFLRPFETLRQAVDLRPQHRTATAHTITRDGIPVKAELEMSYRIGPPDNPQPAAATVPGRRGLRRRLRAWIGGRARSPLPDLPYSFSEESVCRAVYGNRVLKPGPAGAWDAALPSLVASRLDDILSQQQFDKLFDPDPATPRQLPRERIQNDAMQAAAQILSSRGVQLIRLSVGTIELDTEVESLKNAIMEQRIQSWQAEWVRQDMAKVGRSRAEALKIRERARAQVQRDMIAQIADALTTSSVSGEPPEEAVAWRFIQALEQMARKADTTEYLTTDKLLGQDLLQKLGVLRTSLDEPALPPGEELPPLPFPPAQPPSLPPGPAAPEDANP